MALKRYNGSAWVVITPANMGAEPAFSKNTAFNKNFGTSANTVCEGNDSRLSDASTAYQKPVNGIPQADLELAIRNELAKIASCQKAVVPCTTATGGYTAAKVVTTPDERQPLAGDFIAVTFTSGNMASSMTLNVAGLGAKPVRLAGGAPTGLPETGASYCVAGNKILFYFDGDIYWQFGSQDITDLDTTAISNIVGAYTSNLFVNGNSTSGASRYPFIGRCEDDTIDKITYTTSSIAEGTRTFTGQKIKLSENILYSVATSTAWTAGSPYEMLIYSRYYVSTTNWKYAIGEYYNKSGVLTGNGTTTDLVNTPLYIGGERDETTFVPKEFSLTLRNQAYVYKQIGYFGAEAAFYLSENQPVYIYNEGWQILKQAYTASEVGAEPAFSKNTAFNKNFGSTVGTVCDGNDSRLSDARTPTALVLNGAIGGHIERTNTTGLTLANAPYTILTVSQSVYDGISANIKAVLLRAYITE